MAARSRSVEVALGADCRKGEARPASAATRRAAAPAVRRAQSVSGPEVRAAVAAERAVPAGARMGPVAQAVPVGEHRVEPAVVAAPVPARVGVAVVVAVRAENLAPAAVPEEAVVLGAPLAELGSAPAVGLEGQAPPAVVVAAVRRAPSVAPGSVPAAVSEVSGPPGAVARKVHPARRGSALGPARFHLGQAVAMSLEQAQLAAAGAIFPEVSAPVEAQAHPPVASTEPAASAATRSEVWAVPASPALLAALAPVVSRARYLELRRIQAKNRSARRPGRQHVVAIPAS